MNKKILLKKVLLEKKIFHSKKKLIDKKIHLTKFGQKKNVKKYLIKNI